MKITKKQRDIQEIVTLIIYMLTMVFQLLFIHNMTVFIIGMIVFVLALITDFVFGINRSNTIRQEIIASKEDNIIEIKKLIDGGAIEGLSSLQIDSVLTILKKSKNYEGV